MVIMVKIDVGSRHVFTLKIETDDFELEPCKAKMSRSIKNIGAYYLLNAIPVFLHLGEDNKISVILPTDIKKKKS